ncbi:putative RNA recognition motif domain, nucleotide-binding alpha-beta plait domain superfamily [Helianthus debilis subsp. tardiflorus]
MSQVGKCCKLVVSAKVIRNKQSGQSEGYGFIEFVNRAAAERHLQAYNGTLMPNVEQLFRLNWASFGAGERKQDDTPDYTIFVGDLAADVTDYTLLETFRAHYPSVKGAKVVTDRITGRTKGYGFVKFGDESEQLRAMTEMNGRLCSTRPMRIGPAANKKNVGSQQYPNGTCCCFYSLSQFSLLILSAWVLNLCVIRLVPCEMILV